MNEFKSKIQIDPMMNKKLSIISSLVFGLLCWAGFASAQFGTLNHPYNTGVQTIINVSGVGGTYYDNGGPIRQLPGQPQQCGNYPVRFQPTTGGAKVQATFVPIRHGAQLRRPLCVGRYQTPASPLIASGNGAPARQCNFWGAGGFWGFGVAAAPQNQGGGVIRATAGNATGNLTFGFVSDGSVQYSRLECQRE
jgi:hypothetical protein